MSKRTPEEIIHSVKRYQQGETSQGAEAKRLGVSKKAGSTSSNVSGLDKKI